jgi:hypothetical protein
MAHLKLSGLFLDPLGHHLLLSLSSRNSETPAELLYLSRKTSKPKQVSLSLQLQYSCRHITELLVNVRKFHSSRWQILHVSVYNFLMISCVLRASSSSCVIDLAAYCMYQPHISPALISLFLVQR